ncbi:hypothetical protein GW17_00037787 [Ensete ventricosum]|nr:hypothetical protein GW17_00037787 [Ensete ventricosum]
MSIHSGNLRTWQVQFRHWNLKALTFYRRCFNMTQPRGYQLKQQWSIPTSIPSTSHNFSAYYNSDVLKSEEFFTTCVVITSVVHFFAMEQ